MEKRIRTMLYARPGLFLDSPTSMNLSLIIVLAVSPCKAVHSSPEDRFNSSRPTSTPTHCSGWLQKGILILRSASFSSFYHGIGLFLICTSYFMRHQPTWTKSRKGCWTSIWPVYSILHTNSLILRSNGDRIMLPCCIFSEVQWPHPGLCLGFAADSSITIHANFLGFFCPVFFMIYLII